MRVFLSARRFAAGVLLTSLAAIGSAQILPRPISDFLSTQGTYCPAPSSGCTPARTPEGMPCCLFVPPSRNYVGWTDPRREAFGLMDYAGVAASAVKILTRNRVVLPTETVGSIHERLLPDGRAEVTVLLYARNALAWGNQSLSFATPPDFGNSAGEVIDGHSPTLGDVFMHLVFVNPRIGARIPDLGQLFFEPRSGEEFRFISFQGVALGRFRNGERGLMTISQIGFPDRFPAEIVSIRRL